MITDEEANVISLCLQGFFYGKISVLCALASTLQSLPPGLGLYSGIFAIYLQCPLNESRTANIIFHAFCVLYVLSTATIVSNLLSFILEVSDISIYMILFFIS